jgi:hypothetical protein
MSGTPAEGVATEGGRRARAARAAAGEQREGRGRAFGLGPSRVLALAALVLAGALLAVLTGAVAGGHGSTTRTPLRYGGLPSWLPKPKVPVNRTLHASAAHRALAIQGETVAVKLAGGSVMASAAGPSVPETGRFPVPETTPCTFVLTFSSASGTVPLRPAAFTFVDERGDVHHPRVTTLAGGPVPREVTAGAPLSLKVRDVLPTGDGGLLWAPEGGRPLVAWDFTVEID